MDEGRGKGPSMEVHDAAIRFTSGHRIRPAHLRGRASRLGSRGASRAAALHA